MRLKLFTLGLAGSFLFVLCTETILLVFLLGRLWLEPDQQSEPVKVVVLAPLTTPTVGIDPGPIVNAVEPTPTAPLETPEALLPTVTPTVLPLAPTVTPNQAKGIEWAASTSGANPETQAEIATRLVIPAIGLDTPVVLAPRQGDSWRTDHLGQTVGQLAGTAPPGSNSNIVLGGHYTLIETNGGPGPFFQLSQLVPGDVVIVYRGEERFEYILDNFQKVDISAVEITFPTQTAQITLLTCSDWDGGQSQYIKRLVLRGHLKG